MQQYGGKYLTTSDHSAEDLALLSWAYKRSREYARRLPSYRGELASQHPQFSAQSKALCGNDTQPVPIDAPDIEYTKEDDKEVEEWTRKVGTCFFPPQAFDLLRSPLTVRTAWHSVSIV